MHQNISTPICIFLLQASCALACILTLVYTLETCKLLLPPVGLLRLKQVGLDAHVFAYDRVSQHRNVGQAIYILAKREWDLEPELALSILARLLQVGTLISFERLDEHCTRYHDGQLFGALLVVLAPLCGAHDPDVSNRIFHVAVAHVEEVVEEPQNLVDVVTQNPSCVGTLSKLAEVCSEGGSDD